MTEWLSDCLTSFIHFTHLLHVMCGYSWLPILIYGYVYIDRTETWTRQVSMFSYNSRLFDSIRLNISKLKLWGGNIWIASRWLVGWLNVLFEHSLWFHSVSYLKKNKQHVSKCWLFLAWFIFFCLFSFNIGSNFVDWLTVTLNGTQNFKLLNFPRCSSL